MPGPCGLSEGLQQLDFIKLYSDLPQDFVVFPIMDAFFPRVFAKHHANGSSLPHNSRMYIFDL